MPNVDLYLRVSTVGQKEDGYGLAAQERECRALAEKLGLTILEVFREDFPGDRLERPLLDQLRERAHKGIIQAVIMHDPDRLARDPILQAIVELELEKLKIDYHYVTSPADNSPEGRLIRYIKGYSAQIDRLRIRDRTYRGRRERAYKGKLPTGAGPGLYGYIYNKETDKREINPTEADVIRSIFQYACEGLTAGKIAIKLNELGIAQPKSWGKQWHKPTVVRILRNRVYLGESYALKTEMVAPKNPRTPNKRRIKSNQVLKPQDQWIKLPEDLTPPIIESAVFEAAQKVLEANKGHGNNRKFDYLLAGHLFCGVCGRKFYGYSGNGFHYYRCIARNKLYSFQPCTNRNLNSVNYDAEIWQALAAYIKERSTVSEAVDYLGDKTVEPSPLLNTLHNRLADLEGQENRILKLFRFGKIAEDVLLSELDQIHKDQVKVQAELNDLQASWESYKAAKAAQKSLDEYCIGVADKIDSMSFPEKLEVVEAFDLRVIVYPDHTELLGVAGSL